MICGGVGGGAEGADVDGGVSGAAGDGGCLERGVFGEAERAGHGG